jgi:hypothetical protein
MSLNNLEEKNDIDEEFVDNTNGIEEEIINSKQLTKLLPPFSSPTSIPEVFNKNLSYPYEKKIESPLGDSENCNQFSTSLLNNINIDNLSDVLPQEDKIYKGLKINVDIEANKSESQDSIAYFPNNSHLPAKSSVISPINYPLKSGNINGSPMLTKNTIIRPGPLSIDDSLFNGNDIFSYKSTQFLNKSAYLGNEAIGISRGLLENSNESLVSPTSKIGFEVESVSNSNNSSLNAIDQCLDALSLNTNLSTSDGLISKSSIRDIQGVDNGKFHGSYNFDTRINNNLSPINSPFRRQQFNQNSNLEFPIDYNNKDLGESTFQCTNSLRSPYPSSPMKQFDNSFNSPYSNSSRSGDHQYQNRDISLLTYNNGFVYTVILKFIYFLSIYV